MIDLLIKQKTVVAKNENGVSICKVVGSSYFLRLTTLDGNILMDDITNKIGDDLCIILNKTSTVANFTLFDGIFKNINVISY